MQMVENGSFFSPCYPLNDPEDVAKKIYSKANLPAFTGITDEDKSHINRARYNLFALLIPVHDRETALQEFLEVSLAWAEQSKHFTALEITKTFLKYEQVNSNEGFLKKYTEESFLYHIHPQPGSEETEIAHGQLLHQAALPRPVLRCARAVLPAGPVQKN